MTEYEIFELLHGTYEKMNVDTTIYFTLVSAYLVVAFLVGSTLTRIQLFIVSTLYILWSLGTVNALHIGGRAAQRLQEGLIEMESRYFIYDDAAASTAFWVFSFNLIQLTGILASLYFMWSVRHPKREVPL